MAEGTTIDRIVEQLGKTTIIKTGFGRAVLDLLNQFGLPDADVLAKHYQANPRADGRKWPDLLAKYRGTVMHRGYFDFRTGDQQIMEVYRVLLHLHDIVLRLIFKMLGYGGPYLPTVCNMRRPRNLIG